MKEAVFHGIELHSSLDRLVIAELYFPANEFGVTRQRYRLSGHVSRRRTNGTVTY